jgi:hypothetical protein
MRGALAEVGANVKRSASPQLQAEGPLRDSSLSPETTAGLYPPNPPTDGNCLAIGTWSPP